MQKRFLWDRLTRRLEEKAAEACRRIAFRSSVLVGRLEEGDLGGGDVIYSILMKTVLNLVNITYLRLKMRFLGKKLYKSFWKTRKNKFEQTTKLYIILVSEWIFMNVLKYANMLDEFIYIWIVSLCGRYTVWNNNYLWGMKVGLGLNYFRTRGKACRKEDLHIFPLIGELTEFTSGHEFLLKSSCTTL